MDAASFPFPATPCTEQAAASVLLRRHARTDTVVYVQTGRVVLGWLDAAGQAMEHLWGEVQGPAWLNAASAVVQQDSAVDALAATPVTLRLVPVATFAQALHTGSVALGALLHDIALAHHQQTELAASRLAKDADARCAEWLLRHAEVGDTNTLFVRLQERKRQIAAQLGIAPETFSRVLRHLRERSLISGSGRVVTLVDPGGLRSLAGA